MTPLKLTGLVVAGAALSGGILFAAQLAGGASAQSAALRPLTVTEQVWNANPPGQSGSQRPTVDLRLTARTDVLQLTGPEMLLLSCQGAGTMTTTITATPAVPAGTLDCSPKSGATLQLALPAGPARVELLATAGVRLWAQESAIRAPAARPAAPAR